MIKKATLEEVKNEIDTLHYLNRLKQLSESAQSEQVSYNATVKILEIDGVARPDGGKTTVKGANIELVVEH